MEGPVRKSKIWFFSFEALNAEKRGVRGVCAGINYDYWSGQIRKKWRKKRALVPSDEGRVRWSSSVRTMFATGNAFEDRNERTWVTVLTGFVWGIMLWRSRCTVLLHLAFFLCLSRTYWPLGPYLFFLHLKGLPCIPLTSFSKYDCSSPGPFKS